MLRRSPPAACNLRSRQPTSDEPSSHTYLQKHSVRATTITAKLAGMRKPQEFVVYPRDGASVVVQSDRAIGQFDARTGEGVLNWRGSNEKFFRHLAPSLGAEPYQFPTEFVARAIANEPMPLEEIGPGVYVASDRMTQRA
jgi:predicted dehydrogenase